MDIYRAYNLRSEKLYHDPWKGKAPSTLVSLCCILGAFFSLRRQISSKWLLLFNVIHISPQILFIPALLLFCLNFLWLFDFSGISITLNSTQLSQPSRFCQQPSVSYRRLSDFWKLSDFWRLSDFLLIDVRN